MIARALTACVAIFALFGGWMLVQRAGRRFARRHPEFGRFREEGGECGKTCGCAGWKHCVKKMDRADRIDPSDRSDRSASLNSET